MTMTMIMMLMLMLMLLKVNDSSMALLGGTQRDEYKHIVDLVVSKMEVYCRKASLSTTTIRFAPSRCLSPATGADCRRCLLALLLLRL